MSGMAVRRMRDPDGGVSAPDPRRPVVAAQSLGLNTEWSGMPLDRTGAADYY